MSDTEITNRKEARAAIASVSKEELMQAIANLGDQVSELEELVARLNRRDLKVKQLLMQASLC